MSQRVVDWQAAVTEKRGAWEAALSWEVPQDSVRERVMEMVQSQQALVSLAKLSEAPWELCKQRQEPSIVQDLVCSSIFFL